VGIAWPTAGRGGVEAACSGCVDAALVVGGQRAGTWLGSMCQGTRGADAVDAADVARSCGDKAANRSVSEAGAAVVAVVFGVPVTVLVVNRSCAVQ
jgi:hypothetical protein